ncbi:MAG TPA: hypothetical protein VNE42_11410 [Acidimicrobiales bacterium]|nr:hypothetical protein [Acidimicrobiales bacterium]
MNKEVPYSSKKLATSRQLREHHHVVVMRDARTAGKCSDTDESATPRTNGNCRKCTSTAEAISIRPHKLRVDAGQRTLY